MKPSDRIRELSKRNLPGEWKTDDCDPRAIVAHLDEDHGRLTERLEYLEGMAKSLAWFLGEGGAENRGEAMFAREDAELNPFESNAEDQRTVHAAEHRFAQYVRDQIRADAALSAGVKYMRQESLKARPITREDVERVAEWLDPMEPVAAKLLRNFADREFGK